jgi:hypothetical protein
MKPLATILGLLLFGAEGVSAAVAQWSDRAEYDLVLSIRAEAVPQKRLLLLDQWKQKYPKSEMRQHRRELYLAAYQSLSDSTRMLAVTLDMLNDDPGSYVGMYWISVLLPEAKQPSAEVLAVGEKSARRLVAELDSQFAPARKPAAATPEAWTAQRKEVGLLAHRALVWIAWQRGDLATVQSEATICLKTDPARAEISAWYGAALAGQKEEPKEEAALWHLARAASLKNVPGALSDPERRRMDALFERVYSSYHGSAEGMEEVRGKAVAEAFPAPTFKVESAAVIAARKAKEDFERANPELVAWQKIKEHLDAADGDTYFTESLKGHVSPVLKGTVLKSDPAKRPSKFVLALSDSSTEEVVLRLQTGDKPAALAVAVPAGTRFEFHGILDSFVKSPFALAIVADPADVRPLDLTPPEPPKQQ